MSGKRLFCEINPLCYAISEQKEILKRNLQDMRSTEKFAVAHSDEKLPVLISSADSTLIKKGKGIDPVLQENKVVNIKLANEKINGIVIHPGETFSFCRTVGRMTKHKGYKAGRVIGSGGLKPGIGGGLCNLGNTIHRLVLHSPLEVTEFHSHSDALSPDGAKRVPFSSGTCVSYNNVDYRFKNTTDRKFQLLVWCDDEKLHGELRSEKENPYRYELLEEDHHFAKEGEKYYRISKIYKLTFDKATGDRLGKELVLDNHSEVMYDYSLIPEQLIRE